MMFADTLDISRVTEEMALKRIETTVPIRRTQIMKGKCQNKDVKFGICCYTLLGVRRVAVVYMVRAVSWEYRNRHSKQSGAIDHISRTAQNRTINDNNIQCSRCAHVR